MIRPVLHLLLVIGLFGCSSGAPAPPSPKTPAEDTFKSIEDHLWNASSVRVRFTCKAKGGTKEGLFLLKGDRALIETRPDELRLVCDGKSALIHLKDRIYHRWPNVQVGSGRELVLVLTRAYSIHGYLESCAHGGPPDSIPIPDTIAYATNLESTLACSFPPHHFSMVRFDPISLLPVGRILITVSNSGEQRIDESYELEIGGEIPDSCFQLPR